MTLFSKPYPLTRSWSHHLRIAVWCGVFVFLFLALFRPFGIGNYKGDDLMLVIAGYGLVTMIVLLLVHAMGRLLLPVADEEKWTSGKEILCQLGYIFSLGIANALYTHLALGMHLTVENMTWFQFYTLLIGLFPITFFVLRHQQRMLKANIRSAEDINERLRQKTHAVAAANIHTIRLTSENDKDIVELPAEELVLIESSDNYSTVYFAGNGKLESKLIRSSLKRLESQINHPDLIRCHRTYIINLQKVISVSGNAQGYRLRFEGLDQSIPVSRTLNEAIKERLQHLA